MPDLPVFYVRTPIEKKKVLEKVVAEDATKALAKAKELLGDVEGLFVTGPHERAPVADVSASSKI